MIEARRVHGPGKKKWRIIVSVRGILESAFWGLGSGWSLVQCGSHAILSPSGRSNNDSVEGPVLLQRHEATGKSGDTRRRVVAGRSARQLVVAVFCRVRGHYSCSIPPSLVVSRSHVIKTYLMLDRPDASCTSTQILVLPTQGSKTVPVVGRCVISITHRLR